MRRDSVKIIIALVVIAMLTVASGCSKDESSPLRIGINAWPGYEFLYLAQERGFYRDIGLDIRLIEFSSLADARRAFERGQIDGLATTVVEVLQSRDQSPRSLQIVQVVDYSDGADVIIARKNLEPTTSLRASRIGVELASLGVYVLDRGLEHFGLEIADVKAVSMDQLSMEESLIKGELDAIVTYPPTSIKLLRDKQFKTIFSSKEIPGEVLDVIAVDAKVLKKRPSDIEKMIQAFHRAVRYSEEDPATAYKIMAEREGISAAEFEASLRNGVKLVLDTEQHDFLRAGGKLSMAVDKSDRVLRKAGQIKGADRRADIIWDVERSKGQ